MLITWNYSGGSECLDRFIVEYSPKGSSCNEPESNMAFKVVSLISRDIKNSNCSIRHNNKFSDIKISYFKFRQFKKVGMVKEGQIF